MKRGLLLSILILLLSVQAFAAKRAFLICIGDYPEDKGWAKISSGNDLVILSSALSHDYIIESLSDSEATYSNVVKFLNGIKAKLSPSDTVLIHFSCHGQQMNLNVDDVDMGIDGLDEALVAYDAEKDYSEHYKGECHLRDNEFGDITESLRFAIGPGGLLVVTFDACHSDSMYRGDSKSEINGTKIRGYAGIFGPEPDSLTLAMLKEKHHVQDTTSLRTREGQCEEILISACKASDRNRETVQNGVGYGSLSYSISEAFENTNGFDEMDMFVSSVLSEMKSLHPGQEPVVRSSFPMKSSLSGNDYVEPERNPGRANWLWYILIPGGLIILTVIVCRRRRNQ